MSEMESQSSEHASRVKCDTSAAVLIAEMHAWSYTLFIEVEKVWVI